MKTRIWRNNNGSHGIDRCSTIALLWLFLLTMAAPNLQGTTFTVTRTNATGPGSFPVILNQANSTPGDNSIEFAVSGMITLTSSLLTTTNNLTINGRDSGIIINGASQYSLFAFGPGTTNTLNNLTLIGGYGAGGAAISNAGTLFIDTCSFTNHNATISTINMGGAIYSLGPVTVANSSFSDCSAAAGGAIASLSTLTVSASTFSNNRATQGTPRYKSTLGGCGGAIFFHGPQATISHSSFGTNSAYQSGGAIYLDADSAIVSACAAIGNAATFAGGAIYTLGTCTLTDSRILHNNAQQGGGICSLNNDATVGQLLFRGLTVSSNFAYVSKWMGHASGGGIASFANKLDLSASTLSANACGDSPYYSGSGYGGGLFIGAGVVTITNSTFSGNIATWSNQDGGGGGIYVIGGTLTLMNCTIAANTYGYPANGLFNYSGTVNLCNTLIANNESDVYGKFVSSGFNLIGNSHGATGLSVNDYQDVPANIGPLQDNGGPTFTHALLQGSLAIGAGTSVGAPTVDQRGVARPIGRCDIGAFQFITLIVPTITWNSPTDIIYSAALSSKQLNASATAAGVLTYNPPAGTVLLPGSNQVLRVVFTPTDSSRYTGTSNSVMINVLKANQTIAFNPLDNKKIGDAPVILSASASSGLPVTFSLISGPATLIGNLLSLGSSNGWIVVRASQAGNTNYNAAPNVDGSFYLGTLPLPIILSQPFSQTLSPGDRLTLTVVATNGPLNYQWRFVGSPIPGQTGSSLVLGRVQASQGGPYDVIVSNPSGSVTSRIAMLTVNVVPGSPIIIQQPLNLNLRLGENALLSVFANGSPPFLYQWYRGLSGDTTSPIPGATNANYTVGPSSNSVYWVNVRNPLGSADSDSASIIIFPANAAKLRLQMYSGLPGLIIDGVTGTTYRIEYSKGLTPTNWTKVIDLSLPSNPFTFIDTGAVNAPSRFYRAVVP